MGFDGAEAQLYNLIKERNEANEKDSHSFA